MDRSLEAFMKEIIDYAGLFPPADLALDPAIRNYTEYRKGPNSDMLSRFIIPAGMLADLEPYRDLFAEGQPFDFSVLGKGTEMVSDFIEEVQCVSDSCSEFNNQHNSRTRTGVLEIKLSKEAALSGDVDLIKEGLHKAAKIVGMLDSAPEYVFYEGLFEESWKNDIEAVIQAIADHNASNKADTNYYKYAGFKLRCGGVEASMFPTVEQVAFSINKAREYNVALKCTAGLHHPVRHYNDSVQTRMHGFFNVFGGAMLSYAHDLNDEELIIILNEEDHEHFSFTDEAFSWKELSISTEDIRDLREVALISFGSCSFDEPREDLQKLGLLNLE